MLESLQIRNFALFEQASIQFDAGLHVLTGETGAGKSLVVDAVNLLCGARADKELIRTGSETAYVEGIFNIDGLKDLQDYLNSQEISPEEGRLILSREISLKGRSLCRVNGMAFSLAAYQELTSRLVDLHGQHEHQSLLQEGKHLAYLDLLGNAAHQRLLMAAREAFQQYSEAKKAHEKALSKSRNAAERLEVLRIRQKELRNAKLVPGEEEELTAEKNLLRNAGRISAGLQDANQALSDHPRGDDALNQVRQALEALEKIQEYHPSYKETLEKLQSLYYELEEVSHGLTASLRGLHHDDTRLEEVESRLDMLRKLQRKYGPDSMAMLEMLAGIEEELRNYESLDEQVEALSREAEERRAALLKVSRELSGSRKALAGQAEKKIEELLHSLNMDGTRFYIKLHSDEQAFSFEGIDRISMLIAPNAGEEPKPLAKIASGGELSRVMLAMKTLSAERNVIPTMVFDEIDTGVSGKTAAVIAQKLWDIARYRQVICVTHLHQLAAMASTHYQVSKQEVDGRTKASVSTLPQHERVREIAKMLGDIKTQGESGLTHAAVLLDDAASYRAGKPSISQPPIQR